MQTLSPRHHLPNHSPWEWETRRIESPSRFVPCGGSKSGANNVTGSGATCLWHWRSKSPLLDWGSAVGTAAAVASVYNIVNRLLTSWPRGMLGIRLLFLHLLLLYPSLFLPSISSSRILVLRCPKPP